MSLIDVISDNANKNLQEVPKNVLQMNNLKMLYLENNAIETLPDDFFEKLVKLTWLDLRKNILITIPEGIAAHENLETLLLQNNRIEVLPNELGVVAKLKVLQVSGNPLKYPSLEITNQGILAICSYLKEQYHKIRNHESADEEEAVLSTVTPKSSTALSVSNNQLSVQDLLKHGDAFMPVIDVKNLSKIDVAPERMIDKTKSTNTVKRTHKITRGCSKISLRSHSSWSNKKKIERSQEGELKEIWLKRLTDLLADQEKILQQERNLKALSKWRLKKRLEAPREVSLDELAQPPYDTDPDCKHILSRKDLTEKIDTMIKRTKHTKRRGQEKKVNIQELIDEVVNQMKYLQSQVGQAKSPRTDQEIAGKQIESIVKLHKRIVELQTKNDRF